MADQENPAVEVQAETPLATADNGRPRADAGAIRATAAEQPASASVPAGDNRTFLPAAPPTPRDTTDESASLPASPMMELDSRITQLRADFEALAELVDGASTPDHSKVKALVEGSVAELRADLEARFGKLQAENTAANVLFEATSAEYHSLLERVRPGEIDVLRQELASVRSQVVERDAAIGEMDRELRTLRAAGIPDVQAQLARREAALRSREEAVGEREAMQLELDELRERNRSLEAARSRYEQYQTMYEGDANLRAQKAELERELQDAQDRLEDTAYALAAAQNDAKNKSVTLAAVRQSHEREIARSRELEQEVHRVNALLAPLQKDLERLSGLEAGLWREAEERREAQLALVESQRQSLRKEAQEWKAAWHAKLSMQYAAEREDLIQRSTTAEAQAAAFAQQLERAMADLTASLERETALSLGQVEMEQKVRGLSATARDLETDVKRLERRRDDLDAQVTQLDRTKELRLASARAEEETYRERRRSELAELEGRVLASKQEAESYAQKLQDLKDWYERQYADRSQELVRLDERIAEVRRMEHARLDLSERTRSIHESCFVGGALRVLGPRPSSELVWLADVREGIEALGFSYPGRLLEAFHTSLKIAEWSPLTMLAGISGTGKSELPRLYAHFGGMHFLATPVQPNWDSPQDLFGFFNYMDGRFKATDLLRALAQSQRPRGEDGFDDAMLIVLLDEMNLARIELYFSELLSKLESRRGVSSSSREACMPIDVGSGNPSFQLPLRGNVLYVGTMNEDETTQAISDKVLDRGNVLTFPRPTRLQSRRLAELPERTEALSLSVWEEWVREPADVLHQGVRDTMRSALENVNKGMERVQRAVGHRVLQSIEAYVANHPRTRRSADDRDGSDESWRLAFEDQLAQKIMPKLRGIDGQSDAGRAALSTIREVLEQHAPHLIEDYESATRGDDAVFAWRSAHFLEAHNT